MLLCHRYKIWKPPVYRLVLRRLHRGRYSVFTAKVSLTSYYCRAYYTACIIYITFALREDVPGFQKHFLAFCFSLTFGRCKHNHSTVIKQYMHRMVRKTCAKFRLFNEIFWIKMSHQHKSYYQPLTPLHQEMFYYQPLHQHIPYYQSLHSYINIYFCYQPLNRYINVYLIINLYTVT